MKQDTDGRNGIEKDSLFHGDLVTSKRNIYTPSLFARTNLLYLQEAGTLQARRPHTSSRSGLDSYLFFTVLSGSGILRLPGEKPGEEHSFPIHVGDCVFLDCRDSYSHTTSGDLWQLKWVHFNGTGMHGIYAKYLERSGSPVFHSGDGSLFPWQLDRIYNLSVSDSYVRDMEINAAIAALLTSIMEQSWNPDSERRKKGAKAESLLPPQINDVRDYIEEHYREDFSLDELADHFHFNKYYLTRLFRSRFGLSIGSYHTQVRINEAKKLLRFTELSLSEAGAEVGISDANYFSRIFKKVEGVTPGEYRKAWQASQASYRILR